MSKVIDLLNASKTKLKASSNYQLAKLTGISEQDVSWLYKGAKRPSDEVLARLALVLDRPIGEVLAEVRSEDAKTKIARVLAVFSIGYQGSNADRAAGDLVRFLVARVNGWRRR